MRLLVLTGGRELVVHDAALIQDASRNNGLNAQETFSSLWSAHYLQLCVAKLPQEQHEETQVNLVTSSPKLKLCDI